MPRRRSSELTGRKLAEENNLRLMGEIAQRASTEGHVLYACLKSYQQWSLENENLPTEQRQSPLTNLTHHLISTFETTEAAIRERMTVKWKDDPDAARRIESSVTNSLRRSAGTNYQALVSYAIAYTLETQLSDWYVVHPVPTDFGRSLSIRFGPASQTSEGDEPEDTEDASVVVKPDLDILLRNAAWDASSGDAEPVLVLSVKTSLADRAGSAARWKTYFDLVTQPCEHACEESCAYRRLGIALAESPNVSITHGIVTANIYKMNSDPYFAQYGELRSNQAKANTFMFDLRFTTRDQEPDAMAPGWSPLSGLMGWLADPSAIAAEGANPARSALAGADGL